MQNSKSYTAKTSLSAILLLTLLLAPLAVQTCSAQSIQTTEDKTLSFIRDVIQLDVNQYKITQTGDQYGVEKASLTVTLEPKTPSVSRGNYTMYVEFNSGYFTYFSVTPDAGPLIYMQPRQDRFNETLGILERYQTWLNDSQVGDMATLLRQIGSEQSIFQSSGNLSLNIRLYSDVGEYRFSNYISGVEYSGLCISQSQGGSILFTDNRGSQKIGNATIGVSKNQAIAIAQEYFKTNPPRGPPGSTEQPNVNFLEVKSVTLKSGPRVNFTLYPCYKIEFNVVGQSSLQGCGVSVDANAGEILDSYCSYDFTKTPTVVSSSYNIILLVVVVSVLVCTTVVIGVIGSRQRFNVDPDTV